MTEELTNQTVLEHTPLQCLIIDDEPLAVERLELFINNLSHKIVCRAVCYNPREAWSILQTQDIDLLLMDINFSVPDPNNQEGFDFVLYTKNNPRVPPVIFITGHHPELALKAWDLEVIDFISKPVYPDRFEKAIDKAMTFPRRAKSEGEGANTTMPKLEDEYLDIKLSGRDGSFTKRIWLKEVQYVKSNGNFVEIYTENNHQKPYCPNITLKEFVQKLPTYHFLQCHRSYIVNRQYVESWSNLELVLNNQTKVPIGEKYKDEFLQWLNILPK
jgi:DNA-binding LytR/AlgR family response regulator